MHGSKGLNAYIFHYFQANDLVRTDQEPPLTLSDDKLGPRSTV